MIQTSSDPVASYLAAGKFTPTPIYRYRPYWAKRFGIAPFLPMSRSEMDVLGWDSCDVILVTGDAYIDHPSFGMALIGRLLEAQGFRVGIISQPDWHSTDAFRTLGPPNLYFGVTSGNMDSMVNHYTSDRRIRSNDAYTPNGISGQRPDRAVIVYSQRCREAYPNVNIVIGGIEASLRRIAHFDYWSDQVRRSILLDSKANILLYGNAERAIVELTHRLAARKAINEIRDLRGSAIIIPRNWLPAVDWKELDFTTLNSPRMSSQLERTRLVIRLPAYEQVKTDPVLYAHASRLLHLEANPGNARAMVQAHNQRDVWLNPPPLPLTTPEMDYVYDLPYARSPHPSYVATKIPAWEMICHSVTIMRGCFGGCTFCSITAHEGRIIQNRSTASVVREIKDIRDRMPSFTGVISDIGGPTANMYRLACRKPDIALACRRWSCVYPEICSRLDTNHQALIALYRSVRSVPGIKRVLIGSGIRYDLAMQAPEYIRELTTHHVGGYLKIAPEHTETNSLAYMLKPGIASYETFKQLFEKFSYEANKEQYLIPYFIAAHPGTTDEDMLQLALWLKRQGLRLDQVQTFLPTPLALATTMYHTQRNPLQLLATQLEATVNVVRSGRQRKLHKALLRYHDPNNWALLREALRIMGREDLIGSGKRHLVPRTDANYCKNGLFCRSSPKLDMGP